MGLNDTPSANRIHIGFFGRRNAGKSSLVNAVTGQDLAVVSDTKGTTTDPVYKAMELLPLGPVMIIDTPGFDDEGSLGELRIKKTRQVLAKTDIAVLVADSSAGLTEADKELIRLIEAKNIPLIIAFNKSDIAPMPECDKKCISVSALKKENIFELKELIGSMVKAEDFKLKLVGDLVEPNDLAVLVIPIDKAAPKGRLILPQQQTIRDLLEAGAAAVTVRETELEALLGSLGRKPKLVITDSQVFKAVSDITPQDIKLTSFSILMARFKGFLETAVKGVTALDTLEDGDIILVAEGCTHHRQCEDIGTVKIPKLIRKFSGKDITFEAVSGTEFPEDLSKYKMVIHCGACMTTEREVMNRMNAAILQGKPFTNYGITIAYIQGILKRSVEIFPDIYKYL